MQQTKVRTDTFASAKRRLVSTQTACILVFHAAAALAQAAEPAPEATEPVPETAPEAAAPTPPAAPETEPKTEPAPERAVPTRPAAPEAAESEPAVAPETTEPTAPAVPPVQGQQPPAAEASSSPAPAKGEPPAADGLEEVQTVVVVGRPLRLTEPSGSYDVTTRLGLRDEHPTDTYELFNKTPGVSLSRYGQGIINTDVAIRGFAGDGTSPHAKLLIDGIPSQLHNGYGELDQLFSLGIGNIAVFKGTSDVRYGRFNTAGNYHVTTRTDRATEVQASYGSFNSIEAQAYSGVDLGRVTQNLFVGYRQTDGFRDHSDIQKYSASGRWKVELNDMGSLSFSGRVSGYEGDSPGYLSAEEARQNPKSSAPFANQDGGEKNTQHLSLHFEHGFFEDQLQLDAKLYRQEFERQRWVRFSEAGSLQERFDDQAQTGAIATLGFRPDEDWRVSLGLDVQHDDVIEQRFGTIGQSRLRDTGNTVRNFDYDFQSYGGFLSLEHTLLDRLRWSIGLRADGFGGEFAATDAEGEATTADIIDYGLVLQPKANATAMIVDGLFAVANYGRSFQSPFGSSLYAREGAEFSTELPINDGWEVGAKVESSWGLEARLSYWQQRSSNEFVSVDGESQNVGETDRSGVEAVLSWTLFDSLLVWGNLSWSFTEISNPGDAAPDTVGNRLRSVPDYTTSFGARYDITQNVFVATHFDGQGSYHVNESNQGGEFGDYLLAHAEAGFQDKNNRIQLQVNNVFDSYVEYVFDFSADGTATIHAPGAGVNANVSYTRTF